MSQVCLSQPSISEANKLRQEGKLEAAIIAYKNDYKTTPTDWKNTYNLACVYALTAQKDSAYHYLDIALKDDTSLWALADSDLYALIDDPRWAEVENRQIERFQKYNGKLKESEVAKKWLNIILKDQALDYYIDQAKAHFMKEGSAPQWYYPLGMF